MTWVHPRGGPSPLIAGIVRDDAELLVLVPLLPKTRVFPPPCLDLIRRQLAACSNGKNGLLSLYAQRSRPRILHLSNLTGVSA